MDTYPIEKVYDCKMSRLEIIYVHEVRYGEAVDVYYQDQEDNSTLFAVKDAEGNDCVRARICWGD
jgi:acyl-ACP thioesterase